MKTLRSILFGVLAALVVQTQVSAAPDVYASVKPVHSLVAAVMRDVGDPHIIVDGAGSPHAYSLKPSQARGLERADVIFWVGPGFETFLKKPIAVLGSKAEVIELSASAGLLKLGLREGGAFEPHDEGAHDEGSPDGHDAHDHADEARPGSDHDATEHGPFDMHLWLDPQNAKSFVVRIERALSLADPANAPTYRANAKTVLARLDALALELASTLRPVKDKPFIVFHDAYQYFESRFGIRAAGSISVSPETIPGAERIMEIRTKVRQMGATCVFAEPQFEPKLVSVVLEGAEARYAVLDPLGAAIRNGPDLYFTVLRSMADTIATCLSAGS